jgi:hypothetical protein
LAMQPPVRLVRLMRLCAFNGNSWLMVQRPLGRKRIIFIRRRATIVSRILYSVYRTKKVCNSTGEACRREW